MHLEMKEKLNKQRKNLYLFFLGNEKERREATNYLFKSKENQLLLLKINKYHDINFYLNLVYESIKILIKKYSIQEILKKIGA